jgi:hypothetical protein
MAPSKLNVKWELTYSNDLKQKKINSMYVLFIVNPVQRTGTFAS